MLKRVRTFAGGDWLYAMRSLWARDSTALADPVDVPQWRVKLSPWAVKNDILHEPIGVFVHLYYVEMAEEIAACIAAIPADLRIYVSTDSEEKQAIIAACFDRFGFGDRTQIRVMPNRGWDVAPFLLGFADEIRRHPIGLKLHGKRSTHQPESFGREWRCHLLSELVGGGDRAAQALEGFAADPGLGVVMADHWQGIGGSHLYVLGANHAPVAAVLARAGLSISADQPIDFPSGSMFWFRSEALQPMLDLGLTWDDFAEGDGSVRDATIAHAIERTFLIFCAKAGLRWAYLPRRSRWRLFFK